MKQSTTSPPRPGDDATPEPPTTSGREPFLGLSMSQLVGSSAAAATAAALGSRLGLIGTIVGAALISVVTAVAGALYTHSLRRTREVVARTAELLPAVRVPAPAGTGRRRIRWRPVAVAAVVVFVSAGVVVTGVEQLTGRSLDGTGRTSLGQVLGQDRSSTGSAQQPEQTTSTGADSSEGTGSGTSGTSSGGAGAGSSTDQSDDSGSPQGSGSTPTPSAEPTGSSTTDTTGGTGSAESGSSSTAQPTTEPSAATTQATEAP